MSDRPRPRVRLDITDAAAPGDAPFAIRLRQVLKQLLRRWGLRCTRGVWLDQDGRERTSGSDNVSD